MSEHIAPDAASDVYFQTHFQRSLEALLAPIAGSQPAGSALRGTPTCSAIVQARRQDDASVPMGGWEHELKRANWQQAGQLCAAALATQSKDLQLLAWLLEAQLNQTGFAALAPCLHLMEQLCLAFWRDLYPRAEPDGLEHRANIFRWINEKLLPAMRMVPLTANERPRQFCWADWELAQRQEQGKAAASGADSDAPTCGTVTAGIAATPTAFHVAQRDALAMALATLDALMRSVDPLFGDDAPGMQAMETMLRQILALVEGELHKRGIGTAALAVIQQPVAIDDPGTVTRTATAPAGAIRDRADAYARLAETAEYLMQLEPHSPAPYLVRRATEWGRLNTVELYQELFLKLNGQLNIFEMLGLPDAAASTAA